MNTQASQAIEKIDPQAVCEHLEQTGWKRSPYPYARDDVRVYQIAYQNFKGDTFKQVTVPMDQSLSDYQKVMYDVVRSLAGMEGKTKEQVLSELAGSDNALCEDDVEARNALYVKDVVYMVSGLSQRYADFAYVLLKHAAYAGEDYGTCVSLAPARKKAICRKLGWESTQSLDNALQKLVKGNIIERIDWGTYRFNQELFGNGTWQDVANLSLEISYGTKGRTFRVVNAAASAEGVEENIA